jgi:FkbM family methyltransferase
VLRLPYSGEPTDLLSLTYNALMHLSLTKSGWAWPHFIRLPLRLIPKGTVVPIPFGALRGGKWIVGVGLHRCWLGTYELRKQRAFARQVRPGTVVYDIGANVGFYTLLAAKLCGPAGKVHAFEPAPANLACLRRHLQVNRVANVQVHECALADRSGYDQFEINDGCYTGKLGIRGALEVRVESLDHLLASSALDPAGVVKIDVEGAEHQVLLGAESFFRQRKPVLFLATHGASVHADCLDLLSSWGYCLKPLATEDRLESTDEVIAIPAG